MSPSATASWMDRCSGQRVHQAGEDLVLVAGGVDGDEASVVVAADLRLLPPVVLEATEEHLRRVVGALLLLGPQDHPDRERLVLEEQLDHPVHAAVAQELVEPLGLVSGAW